MLQCPHEPFRRTDFSIAHRGAPLQFPEHTKEAYEAGARMGAGIVECDVTFTKDGQLVCRHDECDLHTTTNIVEHAAQRQLHGAVDRSELGPRCCASDLTLAQFRTLKGKMDAWNPAATTAAVSSAARPLAHGSLHRPRHAADAAREHRAEQAARRETHPRAQGGQPDARNAVFGSQARYAQAMIDEFKRARRESARCVGRSRSTSTTCLLDPQRAALRQQAVYLDDVDPGAGFPRLTVAELASITPNGVRIFAPPIPALLAVDAGTLSSCPRSTRRHQGGGPRHHYLELRALGPAPRRGLRWFLRRLRPEGLAVKRTATCT